MQPLKVGERTPADKPSDDIRASRIITLFELAVVDPTELVFVILKLIVLPTSLAWTTYVELVDPIIAEPSFFH